MNMQATDMDTLLIEVWESWLCACRQKGLTLNIKLQVEGCPQLRCDKERISQTLGILLDNAISYAPSGTSIELEARKGSRQLDLCVIDHGAGIPDAQKGRVFERFYRADASHSDKSHYGLGLSIAKEIVSLHNGRIELTDTPDGGCTFKIVLPM